MNEKALRNASLYLANKDPKLDQIISKVKLEPLVFGGNYFVELAESIVSQQLSIKAADTIWKRFVSLVPGKDITANAVLNIPDQKIRDAGLSWSKVSYIKDLAKKTLESGILFEQFGAMTDEEIIDELVKVKGIGRWTGEMFLMFAMGRPDVFSFGDLGLRNAIKKLYIFDHDPTKNEVEKITDKWRPYRTIGARYLWKSLEI